MPREPENAPKRYIHVTAVSMVPSGAPVEVVLNLFGEESATGCPECGHIFQCDMRVFRMTEEAARELFEIGLKQLDGQTTDYVITEQGDTISLPKLNEDSSKS